MVFGLFAVAGVVLCTRYSLALEETVSVTPAESETFVHKDPHFREF